MCIADDTKWLFFRIVPPPSEGEQYTTQLVCVGVVDYVVVAAGAAALGQHIHHGIQLASLAAKLGYVDKCLVDGHAKARYLGNGVEHVYCVFQLPDLCVQFVKLLLCFGVVIIGSEFFHIFTHCCVELL